MRKRKTHSARALGKKSTGKRGRGHENAYAPMIVLFALGAAILAAGYGLTRQDKAGPVASAKAPNVAMPKEENEIAGTPRTAPAIPIIPEQAARKDDQLITGSLPKQEPAATPAETKEKPQAAKKKKPAATAKVEQPKTFLDWFNTGQQKR